MAKPLAAEFADAETDTEPTPEEQVADVEQGEDPAPHAIRPESTEEEEVETKEEPAEDARLAEEEGEEEPAEPVEEKRHKRTAKERRDARKRKERALEERNAALEAKLRELEANVFSLRGNTLETQAAYVDSRLAQCLNDAQSAETFYAQALSANNGTDAVQAQKVREEALRRAGALEVEKKRLADELTRQQNRPAPSPVSGDPLVTANATRFMADNPWIRYTAQGQPANRETQVALQIDEVLKTTTDLDPREPAYWQELQRRTAATLPHVYPKAQPTTDEDDDEEDEPDEVIERHRPAAPANTKPVPKGPKVGSSGRTGGATRNETHWPAHIVNAIKEAGFWDDPKERADAFKYFKGAK